MAFTLEIQMIPVIKSQFNMFVDDLSIDSTAYAEELPVNHRIVDLAFATMAKDNKVLNNADYRRAFKKLNMPQLDVLSIFLQYRNEVSIQKLSKLLRMKPQKIHDDYLNKFIELELVQKVSRYSYCSTDWTNLNPINVVAIEAKLTKWQEALDQAVVNLNFADFSYVALDQSMNFRPGIIQKFIDLNIGLISVSDKKELRIIYKPKQNNHYKIGDFRLQRLRLCRDLICQNSKWSLMH